MSKKKFTDKIAGVELEGKTVLVPYTTMVEAVATGGFGCNPSSSGRAVFVKDAEGNEWRVERYEILGVEAEEEKV